MTYREKMRIVSREIIRGALADADGNVDRAAAALALDRSTLYRLMREAGIERRPYRHRGNAEWRSLQ